MRSEVGWAPTSAWRAAKAAVAERRRTRGALPSDTFDTVTGCLCLECDYTWPPIVEARLEHPVVTFPTLQKKCTKWVILKEVPLTVACHCHGVPYVIKRQCRARAKFFWGGRLPSLRTIPALGRRLCGAALWRSKRIRKDTTCGNSGQPLPPTWANTWRP